MTKLASENASNKANAQGFSLKEGRAAVDGQVAADPAAKAAVAVPVKAALNGKTGAGVAPAVPVKANVHVDAVKKEERDEDGKLISKASEEAKDQGEHLAMVDASASAAVGALSPEAGQDAGGASASDSSSDGDGGDSTPLIIGGVVLLGGGIALAAGGGGGGGKKNTAPTVNATQTVATNEDTKATITVAGTDADGDTLTYTASAPTKGTVTVAGNVLTYTPNANVNGTDTFTVTVSDGKGGTATQTVTVNIAAVNDLPTTTAQTGAVNEDATLTGKLTAADVDGDALTFAISGTAPAGFTLAADGSYTFDGKNAAYQSLAAGATQDVVANFTVSDGKGGSASSTLTIKVTGVNDAPTTSAQTAVATEDAAAVTGKLTAADVDTGDTRTFSLNAPVAGLTLNADGSYSFDPANAAYQSLAAGETKDVVANFTVIDKAGATATSTLTIKVTGVNDAPVATAATAAATEDGAVVTGQLVATDVDNGASLTYAISGTAPAGLTINSNGSYSFDPASYDSLAAGATKNVVANYTVTDEKGATSTSTLTVTVTGVNDAPVAVAATAAATEDGLVVNGQLAATDVDTGDALTYSLNAPVTGLTLNANGSYSFDPASYDSVAAGTTKDVVANYTVTDKSGATSTSTLTITVTGVNDAPVAGDDVFAVTEGAGLTGDVTGNDSDVDAGDVLSYALVGTAPAGLAFGSDGKFAFNANDAAYNSLKAGATQDVKFDYTVSDKHGGSDTATVTITVTGANDAPTFATPTATASVAENAPNTTVVFDANATDVDNGDTLTYSLSGVDMSAFNINAATGEVRLNAPADFEAKSVYSFIVTATDGSGAAATQTVTLNITDVPEVITASLDIDDDGSIAIPRNFDASSGAFIFTDNGGTANNAIINNFGADDRLHFTATAGGGPVFFFSNEGRDLHITYNDGVNASEILINDIFPPSGSTPAFVTNEATANTALNNALGTVGIDYFTYA